MLPAPVHARVVPPAGSGELDALSLLVWLAAQVGAIALCSANVRFTAIWPEQPHGATLAILVAVQLILLSFAFPRLLRSARSSLLIVASALPMIALAGKFSQSPLRVEAGAGLYLVAWTLALFSWAVWAKTPRRAGLAVAMAVLITLGWPALAYCRVEFGPSAGSLGLKLHPVHAILAIKSFHFPPPASWLILSVICGSGAIACGIDRRRRILP